MSLWIALAALMGCRNIEYQIDDHSLLDRLGCAPDNNQAARPEDRPVAVCAANPTAILPIHEAVTFDGTASSDPNGVPLLAWDWTLEERPDGSAAFMPVGGAVRTGFTADVAGDYVAELVVANEACVLSEPCRVDIVARPSEALWVEMFWTLPGDDMDLHLIRDDGLFSDPVDDCFFDTCTGAFTTPPDWGVPGESADDPKLDLDDIPRTGPENINIEQPAPGTYRVYVHDHPEHVLADPNDVFVRIYIDGELAFRDRRTLSGEDAVARVAEIAWPSGTITRLE